MMKVSKLDLLLLLWKAVLLNLLPQVLLLLQVLSPLLQAPMILNRVAASEDLVRTPPFQVLLPKTPTKCLPLLMALIQPHLLLRTVLSHTMVLNRAVEADHLLLVATIRLKVAWLSTTKPNSQISQVVLAETKLIPSAAAET